MSGVMAVAIENPRRARMPDEYVLTGASMNAPMSANSMIAGVSSSICFWAMSRKAPARSMLSRPVRSISKPAPRVSSVDTRPCVTISPSLGVEDPREGQQKRALAGAVRPDDRQRLAVGQRQVEVAERPEVVLAAVVAPEHPGQRALEGRPLRQAQVVADTEVADLDRVGERAGIGGTERGPGRRPSEDPREGGLGALEDQDREQEQEDRDAGSGRPARASPADPGG